MIRYFWPADDEQLAGQFVDSHFDEDGSWWATIQQCGATLALAVTLALTSASTVVATQVFSQSQDDPAGNLVVPTLPAEEAYWQNPVPPVNWPQTTVFADDDVHPTFVQVFTADEDYWQNLVSPVQATNYIQLPIADNDQHPHFNAVNPIVDDAANVWSPQIPPWEPTWTLLFFLDDGSTVPVFQQDADFWAPQIPPQNWPQPAQPFATEDEDYFSQFFSGNDEAVWTPQVPAVANSLLWTQPFVWEQNEQVANLVAFTNEDYWQNPTAPVPDSIWLLRQDAFDTQDPAGSLTLIIGDDGFQPGWTPFVPLPDPGSLLWPQQWPFEQNEPAGSLRTTVDEDFWQNPVAPVNWPQPSLYGFVTFPDETFQTFFNTFAQDEDFWWQPVVPPVQALNIYNQPFNILGQQEDDTPVLVPFIPPPPLFCPLPPTGADSDVAMSNFGGKQPTLALFCRICNSGKPLVVRADYAIWCQDCCTFVSKQDTYMGTVRAPGQFRSIF